MKKAPKIAEGIVGLAQAPVVETVAVSAKETGKRVHKMFKGFRDFAIRGNAIDLAVGVVIGGAFSALVNSLVNSVINPFVAAIFGKSDMSYLFILTINGTEIKFGAFLSAIVNFTLIAATLYFFIIIPLNKLIEITARSQDAEEAKESAESENPEEEPETKEEALLREIRDLLKPKKKYLNN